MTPKPMPMLGTVHTYQKVTARLDFNQTEMAMTVIRIADHAAARVILNQAELVAIEVAKAELIVSTALHAAALAMAASGTASATQMAEYAQETLKVAAKAAEEALLLAKREAELTLRLARSLANALIEVEEDVKLPAPKALIR
jgi:hypothetical protein